MGNTPEELAGSLYVYSDSETGDALAVARYRVGPNGGLAADTIARMQFPTAKLSRQQINDYAHLFATAPELLGELIALRARFHRACRAIGSDEEFVIASTPGAGAAIAKATGEATRSASAIIAFR